MSDTDPQGFIASYTGTLASKTCAELTEIAHDNSECVGRRIAAQYLLKNLPKLPVIINAMGLMGGTKR
jgi:hypothetical protein